MLVYQHGNTSQGAAFVRDFLGQVVGRSYGSFFWQKATSHTSLDSCTPLRLTRSHPALATIYYLQSDRELPNRSTIAQLQASTMDPPGSSLTLSDGLSGTSLISPGDYLKTDLSTPSHSPTLPSLSTHVSDTVPCRTFGPPPSKLPTTPLVDYPSSEDESETQQAQVFEKHNTTVRKKPEPKQYKSAEFVGSTSDDSDADASAHPQQSYEQPPEPSIKKSSILDITPFAKSDKISRMDSLIRGAAVSQPSRDTKKRPARPLAPSPISKRQKHGPFDIESDNDDERDDEGKSDDGFNYDGEFSEAPRRQTVRESQSLSNDVSFRVNNAQRYRLATTPETQLTVSKPTGASQGGSKLNKGRLHKMVANKQDEAFRITEQKASQTPLRSRLMDGTLAGASLQKKQSDYVVDRDTFDDSQLRQASARSGQLRASQKTVRSSKFHSMLTSPQEGLSGHCQQVKLPSDFSDITGKTLNGIKAPSEERLGSSKRPTDSQIPPTQARSKQIEALRAPNPSVPRNANMARSSNLSNSSSLRNTLEEAKAEHRSASKKPDHAGSEWRKAHAELVSAKSVSNAQRPEVGARYGHTLTMRRASTLEVGEKKKGAPTAVEGHRKSIVGSGGSAQASPASPSSRPQANNPEAASTFNATIAADRESTPLQRLTTPDAAKKTVPQPVKHGLFPAVSSEGKQAAAPSTTRQTSSADAVQTSTERRERTPSLPSLLGIASSNPKVVALETTAELQTSPGTGHDVQPRSPTRLPTDGTARTGNLRAEQTFGALERSLHESGVTTPAASLSVNKSMNRRKGASTDPTNVAELATEGSPKAATVLSEHSSEQSMALDITGPMDICNETSATHASEVCGISFAASQRTVRPQVPVAVMVRPTQVLDAPFLPRNETDSARDDIPVIPEIRPHHAASLIKAADDGALAMNEFPVPPGNAEERGDISDSISPLCTDTLSTFVSAEHAQRLLPLPLHNGTSGQRDPNSSEPIKTISTHADVTVSPEAIACVDIERKSPSASFSSGASKPIPESAEPLNPPTPKPTQVEATATTLSTQSIAGLDLAQSCPALDVVDRKISSVMIPKSIFAAQTPDLTSHADIALPSPRISPAAEPYFEYTIHRALASSWSGEITTQISAQPLTTLDTAEAQMEMSFQASKEQFQLLGMGPMDTSAQVKDDGLSVQQTTFESHEDPSKVMTLKLWIERAEVSIFTNHTPSSTFSPPSIGKTVYAIRLWKLAKTTEVESDDVGEAEAEDDGGDGDKDEEDTEDEDTEENESARVHHDLPPICTEIHTTLDAANRAAKRVHIHLSHEKDPSKPLQKQWQIRNLHELNRKIEDLRKEAEDHDSDEEDGPPSLPEYEHGRRKGCWRSVFQGTRNDGREADDYEVLVCKVGVSGPRNL